jgi:hypothetical protein
MLVEEVLTEPWGAQPLPAYWRDVILGAVGGAATSRGAAATRAGVMAAKMSDERIMVLCVRDDEYD